MMLGSLCLVAPATCPRAVGPERLRLQCAQTADGYCICTYFALLNTLLPYLVLHPLLVGDLSPDFLKSSVAHMAPRMVNIFSKRGKNLWCMWEDKIRPTVWTPTSSGDCSLSFPLYISFSWSREIKAGLLPKCASAACPQFTVLQHPMSFQHTKQCSSL